ncbi:MAG: hypothetical protein DCC55_16960 [Chloroflexi bacterium]|nr:MAG: hypothetical protein DCC55_16960 [Chloroflexota bacterium]
MTPNSVGRPPKGERQKRRQLQFSLYTEDIERLEELTDNRSEFIRDCIAKAWEQKYDGEQTLTITVPRWLVQEILQLLKERLGPQRADLAAALIEEFSVSPRRLVE